MSTPVLAPTDAQVALMRRTILTTIDVRRHRRRVRRTVVGAGIALLLAGGTTAAAIYVNSASVDQRNTSFDCYTTTDLSAPHGTSTFVDDGRQKASLLSMEQRARQAVETCVAGYTAVPTDGKSDAVDVPNPTACVLRDGRLAVLPNKRDQSAEVFCTDLGLTAPRL